MADGPPKLTMARPKGMRVPAPPPKSRAAAVGAGPVTAGTATPAVVSVSAGLHPMTPDDGQPPAPSATPIVSSVVGKRRRAASAPNPARMPTVEVGRTTSATTPTDVVSRMLPSTAAMFARQSQQQTTPMAFKAKKPGAST